jgi:hypothetical protein
MDEIAGIPFVCLFDAVYIHFREIKLRLSSKCSGSSEVLCAWVAAYWFKTANVALPSQPEETRSAEARRPAATPCVMSWRNNGW